MKLILVGGYPKGYEKPFDVKTHSGKILHAILNKNGLTSHEFVDLWETKEQEQEGNVSWEKLGYFEKFNDEFVRIIALGKWVYKCLSNSGITCVYLPYPASRRKENILQLEKGLIEYYNEEPVPRTIITVRNDGVVE